MLYGLIIGGIVAFIIWGIATSKKAPSDVKDILNSSSNVITLNSKLEKTIVIKTIIEFAQSGGYKIDSFDEDQGTIVLSESGSATSWGFFFPIELMAGSDNDTTVRIGIKSKAVQIGPAVSHSLEKCANGIRAALYSKLKNDNNVDSNREYNYSPNYINTQNNTKKCPFCAEEIKEEAIVCRFCGRDIPKEKPKPSPEIVIDERFEDKYAEIDRLEKLFESTVDETERGIVAKKLYDLGKLYYWRFIPRNN